MARGHIAVTALLVGSLLIVGMVPTYASAFPGDNGKLTFSRLIPSFGGTNIMAINPDGTGDVELNAEWARQQRRAVGLA